MTDWSEIARRTIAKVHAALPEGATLADRKAAVDAAYPFGARAMWPYKAWLKARGDYLAKYGHVGRGKPKPPTLPHMSPLERMMAKARSEGAL